MGRCFLSLPKLNPFKCLLHLCQSMPLFSEFFYHYSLKQLYELLSYSVVKYYLIFTKLFSVSFKPIVLCPGLKHFSVWDSNRYKEGLETELTSLQAAYMNTRELRCSNNEE